MTRSTVISRRTLLRGTAGALSAAVALPMLEAMTGGTAHAQAAPPKCFGIFFWANGVRVERWVPATTGAGFALSEELAPLAPVREYVSVASGLEVKDFVMGHHSGTVGILSAAPLINQSTAPGGENERSTFTQPSLDVVVARAWAGRTRLRSLELTCLRDRYDEGTTYRELSHNGPNSVNPAEASPAAAFDRLFGVRDATADAATARTAVLDAVAADARALRARLGAADRARIDQHMEHIRAVAGQLAAGPARCGAATRPADLAPTADNLVPRLRAMSDIVALALACDVTRVFSLRLTCPADNNVLPVAGISSGTHDLTHNEGGDQPGVHRCVVFAMEQLAYFLGRLRAVAEPGGTLLDRCGILATSDCQLGRSHVTTDYPILLAGRAGGALRAGVHYRGAPGENATRALLTLLRAVGLPLAEFGTGPFRVTDDIATLRA